jgi:hypothetical protein
MVLGVESIANSYDSMENHSLETNLVDMALFINKYSWLYSYGMLCVLLMIEFNGYEFIFIRD